MDCVVIDKKTDGAPRPRGRPRLLDRDAGLAAAARLFWQHGYEGTSIADLTAAMGVSPPSLYAAFGSKEELYRQAIDYTATREGKARNEALQGPMPAYEAIAFYLHDVARDFTDPSKPRGCMVSNAALQHARENEAIARAVADRRTATTALIVARFERAVRDGELPPDTDVAALAHFYAAVVQGMSAQACDGTCCATLQRMADIALSAWPGDRTGHAAAPGAPAAAP
jgi:AcrR family transcriptional regulator